jgi:2-polyprenyl-6-methoxyphenol hydroxylase-like FAD-dependent oxidoreductase
MVITGVLLTGLDAPDGMTHIFINPQQHGVAFIIPLGGGRFRCYSASYNEPGRPRLSGPGAFAGFVERCIASGAPMEWFAPAVVAGPLASFDCAESWVQHPYRHGVALVGDAAGISDPAFGCGLSLTLRDVRVLSDALLQHSDWDAAADAYAGQHDRYFGDIHRLLDWLRQLFYEPGPAAEARRSRAFLRLAEDPSRAPDVAGLGPECPSDEAAYYNLFGEA